MKISIITVNKNNKTGLEDTLLSVSRYARFNYEYIVIDGGSSDGSCDVIKKNIKLIDFWSSEEDSGIYSAMNKGIRKATGDYCLFLNSGDCISPENNIDTLFGTTNNHADVYYSDVIIIDSDKIFKRRFPEYLDINYFISGTLNHQNVLIRKILFEKVGLYDERMRICADWKFFLDALYNHKAIFKYCKTPFCEYNSYGISSKGKFEKEKNKEMDDGILELLGEIGPSIVELRQYRNSIFGNIVNLFGESKFLMLYLKIFRFFARRIPLLRQKKQ